MWRSLPWPALALGEERYFTTGYLIMQVKITNSERMCRFGRRRRPGRRESGAGFDEGPGDFHDLPALAGLGLIPDRPDGVGITRIAHQQAGYVSLHRARQGFKGVLGIATLSSLQHRQMASGHVKATCQSLERQPAMMPPLPDVGALEFPGFGHDRIVKKPTGNTIACG